MTARSKESKKTVFAMLHKLWKFFLISVRLLVSSAILRNVRKFIPFLDNFVTFLNFF